MTKIMLIKYLVYFLITFFVFFVIWQYISQYSKKSKAASAVINVTFSPKTFSRGQFIINREQLVNIIISSEKKDQKISGFILKFKNSGVFSISKIGQPVVLGTGDSSLFKPLILENNKISYVITNSKEKLPSIINIPIYIIALKPGFGTLDLEKEESQIVGDVVGKEFSWGTVDQGKYEFLSD
jgi:hypothetical protein